jgi:hypothetical protein
MFITIAVVICKLASPAPCVDEIVTDSSMDDTLTLQSCMLGQPMIAKWLSEHPLYHTGYRVERWRCVPGKYQKKSDA